MQLEEQDQLHSYQNEQFQQHEEDALEEKKDFDNLLASAKNIKIIGKQNNQNNPKKTSKLKLVSCLKGALQEKTNSVKVTKNTIAKYKQQILQINAEVDREMKKNLSRITKQSNKPDISTILHGPSTTDPSISNLKLELSKIRNQQKKIKSQISSYDHYFITPTNIATQQKSSEFKNKIKYLELEQKRVMAQKQFLQTQLKQLKTGEGMIDINLVEADLKEFNDKNHQLVMEIKEKKLGLYELEKQDRILTEKIKFYEAADSNFESRRLKNANKLTPQEQNEIKSLMIEINGIIEERNKIENSRNNELKSKISQSKSLQARNMDLVNKLRQYDAWLFRYHKDRIQKSKSQKKKQLTNSTTFNLTKNNSVLSSTKVKLRATHRKIEQNSQNFVEKKKVYELFISKKLTSITLTDEVFGYRLVPSSLTFIHDEEFIYGVSCEYLNEIGRKVIGYKIVPKIRPKEVQMQKIQFNVEKEQIINFVMSGVNGNGQMKYLQIVTSEGNEFKWGQLDNCIANEQKSIRKYESLAIKGQLVQIEDQDAPNYYCLGGLGFVVIFLAPK